MGAGSRLAVVCYSRRLSPSGEEKTSFGYWVPSRYKGLDWVLEVEKELAKIHGMGVREAQPNLGRCHTFKLQCRGGVIYTQSLRFL